MLRKYYLINEKRLVCGIYEEGSEGVPVFSGMPEKAFEWDGENWKEIKTTEISDRLAGYDPYEIPGWQMFHTDIMNEIKEIAPERAAEIAPFPAQERML